MRRSPRDRLIIPLGGALTLMWLAAGFTVLLDRTNTGALEVFLATTTLEGMLAAFVLGVGRIRVNENGNQGDPR
jgi:hypothetical protein